MLLITELETLRQRKGNVKVSQMLFKLRELWQVKISKLLQRFHLIREPYSESYLAHL